ncbi:MAG: sigma-70 family RNA polymerase sigma factor, partial [Fibrella sp.]|nr:sigma-70 family RNA polymerase sigma factor [Armatimonadota bacterium]
MPLLDTWLVHRARAGDTRSFEKIYHRHGSRVYSLLRRLTGGDESTAEDLTQETFLAAYRSLAAWRGDGSLTTWLCGIAIRLYRQHHRGTQEDDPLDDALPTCDDDSNPLARCERAQVGRELEVAIASLPTICRETFVLTYVEGFAYKEVASHLGIPIGTVQSRLNKAKT